MNSHHMLFQFMESDDETDKSCRLVLVKRKRRGCPTSVGCYSRRAGKVYSRSNIFQTSQIQVASGS